MPVDRNPLNKAECLKRAEAILINEADSNLHYAALELRMCIELMSYEKLSSFEKYLPPSILQNTWQPNQLLKILRQLDPIADQDIELHMGPIAVEGITPEDSEYKLVGKHIALNYKWLSKTYNKLGSYVHTTTRRSEKKDRTDTRADLISITRDIKEKQKGSILSIAMITPVHFECCFCKFQNVASHHYLKQDLPVACLNPSCEAEYDPHFENGEINLSPRTKSISCETCSATITIQDRHLRVDLPFKCEQCSAKYKVVDIKWTYMAA